MLGITQSDEDIPDGPPTVYKGIKSSNKHRAPHPNNRYNYPSFEKRLAEYIVRRIHRKRPALRLVLADYCDLGSLP